MGRAQEAPALEVRRCSAMPEVEAKMDREVRKTLRDLAKYEMPKSCCCCRPISRSRAAADTEDEREAEGGGAALRRS